MNSFSSFKKETNADTIKAFVHKNKHLCLFGQNKKKELNMTEPCVPEDTQLQQAED